MPQNLCSGNVVVPHARLNVLDVTLADQQSLFLSVIADCIRHRGGTLRNFARSRNARHARGGQTRRLCRAPLFRVHHSLAKSVEPYDCAAEFGCFAEGAPVCCEGDSQARCREVIAETCGKGRVRRRRRDVRNQVFSIDLAGVLLSQKCDQLWWQVRKSSFLVSPEW